MSGFARLLADAAIAGIFLFSSAAPAADKLPTAGQVLDRYVGLTGGASTWRDKRVERDEIEGRTLDGQRAVLRAAVTVSRSGNSISEIQVPQSGSEGIYKGVAWAESHFSGVRIKRGAEREEAILDARMLEEADWRALYPNSRVAAVETIGNERCYKVLLLPSSTERTEWFSVSSGLLVRRFSYELSPAGAVPTGFTVEEWAERGGIKQPSVMLAWRDDFQYRLSVLSTEYNPKRADLEYPPEVADYLKAEKAGKALPNAEEIVERHIFASGGPEFYEMLRTQKVTGTLTFVAQNIEGRMETLAAGGGKYYQSTDIPGMGKQEEGSDGQIAWARSPAIGPRLKSRKNAAALGVTLDAVGMVEWRLLIDHVQTEAEERIGDRDCYRIRMTPRDGSRDVIRWYDKNTGLLYRSELALRTDMGDLPIVMTIEAYRDVTSVLTGSQTQVKWPSRVRTTASGQDTLFSADEVTLNEPVDDSVFAVPDEIRELARKKAESESVTP